MDMNIIEGNWNQFKGALKQKWSRLTDNDLDNLKGKGQELYGILQEKVGLKKEDFKREFDGVYDSVVRSLKKEDATQH